MYPTTIGGIPLKNCIYNASGVNCITLSELKELDASDTSAMYCGAVLSKSCTVLHRNGNPLPRYFFDGFGSINSSGLPNKGYEYYIDAIPYIQKPFFISVCGLSIDDNITIMKKMNEVDVKIELNLSCPNIIGKSQIGYDFEGMNNLLSKINEVYTRPYGYGVKLPPYFDNIHFDICDNILSKYNISFVTTINSLGNGIMIDKVNDTFSIAPKTGGIGGKYCKPIALSNVYQHYLRMGDKIDIIGCGGISTGRDVYDHILCGASAVQIGTTLLEEGVICFERISKEFDEIMKMKGYTSIGDIRGTIKNCFLYKRNQ